MNFEFIKHHQHRFHEDGVKRSEEFLEVMKKRRSVRDFSSEKVDRKIILNAIETAGTAPSGANCQPWLFALIESDEIKSKIRKAAEEVEEIFYQKKAPKKWLRDLEPLGTNAHKPYLSEAPVLIAVFSRQAQMEQMSYYPLESTGIATGLLLTSLHQAGIATLTHTPRPMFFLNEVLSVSPIYRPFVLIVAGHPKEGTMIPKLERLPLQDICRIY